MEYPPASKNCDVIFPTINDFKLSIELSVKLRKTGTPVGAIDTIISSMCINRGLKIVTKDTDFKAIKAIEPSLNVALKQ
ncbi:type II toxin-antitoxin system VapC family toxin [Candidatus Woesearchaeota archaeon]|nr:type II toxin-antitoxin system VapC family toxin [Candidatus Woesearchaeota archaeon]